MFFLIEVMRALADEAGQLSLVASHHLPQSVLTGGIRAIVQRRLLRLSEDALPLLRRAAIAGRQLDLAVLRCFEPSLEPFLYLAADAAVLEVNGTSWRFAHDKIRESLLEELDPAERQGLHLAVAGAMETIYAGSAAHAAALAEHYQRGGALARAAPRRVEAGLYALSQGAAAQAEALLMQSLAPPSREHLTPGQAARAASGMVQATVALGHFVECMAAYEQLAARAGSPPPAGPLALAEAAGSVLARLLRSEPEQPPMPAADRQILLDVAHAARWAGEAYVWHGQLRKNLQTALHGTELALALNDRALTAYFLVLFSHMAGQLSLHAISQRLCERGIRLLAGLPHSRVELDVRRVASSRHLNAADWSLALSESDTLIALSRQLRDEPALMSGLTVRLVTAFRLGDLGTVHRLGPELYERSRRSQYDQFARVYLLYQAILALRSSEAQTAHHLLSEALVYVRKTQDVPGRILADGLMSRCLLLLGRREEALAAARALLSFAASARLSLESAGEGLSALTEVVLDLWEAGDAEARRHLAEPMRRALSLLRSSALIFPGIAPRALLWHGRVAWSHGASWLSRALAAASLRRAEALAMPFDQDLGRTWLARFAASPPGGAARPSVALVGELRGALQLLQLAAGGLR